MSTVTVSPDEIGLPVDYGGRPITPSRLRRALRLNIAVGAMGMAWYSVCSAQQVLQVFFKNHLDASDRELGLLVAVGQFAAPFHLLAILIYGWLSRRKVYWVVIHVLHRLLGYVLAGVAIHAARGGDRDLGVAVILWASAASWVLTMVSAAGWWSWIADLVPENVRGTFFGRRSAIIHAFNMIWFFAIQISLDYLTSADSLHVYAFVFALGGTLGILDIVLHAFIPEPKRHPAESNIGWREFLEPMRNWNFVQFSLAIGLFTFSTSIFGPFIAPYITADVAKGGIGAPNTWLGIMFVIGQSIWIATVTAWGMLMDRFGTKPIVILGALFPLTWVGYLFLTPTNYCFILPVVALLGGLISPGYWNGVGQLMLTLTPQRNRTAFVAWHSVIVGMIAAGGSILGGVLKDAVREFHTDVGGIPVTSFHVVAAVCFVLCAPSLVMLSRIRKGRERPVGFVVSRLATPGVFRTFLNLSTITSASSSTQAARALRTMDGASSHLAAADIIERLDDPDPEVREEAARALGRIGSLEAVDALVARLRDPASTIRPEAARALGQIGDPRAVPALIEGLGGGPEELEDTCAQALGTIGGRESLRHLRRALNGQHAERVFVSTAEAVSKHGILEAAMDIFPRLHTTTNPVLRGQLAIAMGNLLGEPGQFYRFLTGETAHQGKNLGRLFRSARRAVRSFRASLPAGATPGDALDDLEAELARARGLMEGQSYRAAIEVFYAVLGRLVRLAIGRECPDDVALDYAFPRDPKLGLGFWFIREVKTLMGKIGDPVLLHIDALLALYFLSVYRAPA